MKIKLKINRPEWGNSGTLEIQLVNDEGWVEDTDWIHLSELKAALEEIGQP